MFAVGASVYYRDETKPVTILCNEDGYIAIKRDNGSEVEPVKLSDLSAKPPERSIAKKFTTDEKQCRKMFSFIEKTNSALIDKAELEYRLSAEMLKSAPLGWKTLSYMVRIQFVAVSAGKTVERLFKEYA